MLDKTKRYLVVGLGLLGGKYALELTRAGFHVDGINRSEGHLQYALEHGYIASGKTHDFEDLVRQADHIIFGLYPTALLDWFRTYGSLLKPGCIFTDVSGVKTGLVEPVQALCPAGVEFIASHPMAGRETSSVEHAAEVNFAPANFIITPTEKNTPAGIQWAKEEMDGRATIGRVRRATTIRRATRGTWVSTAATCTTTVSATATTVGFVLLWLLH